VMGRSPSVTATIATVAVEIDGDGVVHRARHAVTLRVLPKRRKRKRRARLREERGWIHGIAGVHDVSRVPVTGHHDPRHGEGGHDPRGGAATCPQDHHEQDDDRGWHRVRLDTDGEPRERRRVPGVDRDHARALVHAPGNRERQCAEERSRQREISVGEARRHHVGALRRREEHDGNGPGEGATAETCCQLCGTADHDAGIHGAGETDPCERVAARRRKRHHEPGRDDAGRHRVPRLHRERMRRCHGGDRALLQPQRGIHHVVRVVVPDPQARCVHEMRPHPRDRGDRGEYWSEEHRGRERRHAGGARGVVDSAACQPPRARDSGSNDSGQTADRQPPE